MADGRGHIDVPLSPSIVRAGIVPQREHGVVSNVPLLDKQPVTTLVFEGGEYAIVSKPPDVLRLTNEDGDLSPVKIGRRYRLRPMGGKRRWVRPLPSKHYMVRMAEVLPFSGADEGMLRRVIFSLWLYRKRLNLMAKPTALLYIRLLADAFGYNARFDRQGRVYISLHRRRRAKLRWITESKQQTVPMRIYAAAGNTRVVCGGVECVNTI